MRICLVYDCLFPHTVGGAERWYRSLAERLAADGHEVTYLTLRQWDRGVDPGVAGVDVRVVGPAHARSTADRGRRRICRRSCSAPASCGTCFATAAATTSSTRARFRTSRCWRRRSHACAGATGWSSTGSRSGAAGYWREYLGRVGGDIGWLVQRLCARVPPARVLLLAAATPRGCATRAWRARSRCSPARTTGRSRSRRGVRRRAAGRVRRTPHPREARAGDPAGDALAREQRLPDLRAAILGDGPERSEVLRLVGELGLEAVVEVPGFVATETVEELDGRARCACCCPRGARATGWS